MSRCNRTGTLSTVTTVGNTRVVLAAGPQGPIGPRGLQGEQGLTGATGPTGPAGPSAVLAYGAFYNNSSVIVPPCSSVPICFTMISAIPVGVSLVNGNIVLTDPGVYLVDFTVYTEDECTLGLCLNGNLIAGAVFTNSGIINGKAIITTVFANQMIKIVNLGEDPCALTAPVAGSSNVIITILRID